MLIEFASVVDAVRCAVEVQQGMVERNAQVPEARRIKFRMGIDLGDIIRDGRDIYGDGVNIAARLEALAEPGAVFVSNTVHEHVRDRLRLCQGNRIARKQGRGYSRASFLGPLRAAWLWLKQTT
jgi:adenylate cyclase